MTKKTFTEFVFGKKLDLSRQNLVDQDILAITRFLFLHPEIKYLDLSLNNIGDRGIADFAERNQTIIQANFSGNSIGDLGLGVFAQINQTVREVNFSYNPISDKAIITFAETNQTCFSTKFTTIRYH